MSITITSPCIITPRLLPGVEVNGAFVSIGYSRRAGDGGRVRYEYFIDLPAHAPLSVSHEGDDLQSGCGGGNLRDGLESLLAFLSACGESVNYATRTGRAGENEDLFPPIIGAWCAENSDEIGMLQLEVEETPDCIAE